MSEESFHDAVLADLRDAYSEHRVHDTRYLEVTERFCDVYVETPGNAADLAIEIEDTFEDVFTGIGQALLYGTELGAQPVVLVPSGGLEYPEAFYLGQCGVLLYQYPARR